MLSIIFILAGAMLPVVSDSINTARLVRAQNDVSQIAIAMVNFQRDVGPFLSGDASGSHLTTGGKNGSSLRAVDLLVSAGDVPAVATDADASAFVQLQTAGSVPGTLMTAPNVIASLARWVDSPIVDSLDDQLRINRHGYQMSRSGPGSGWNGPYLSREISADPWGNRYMINTANLKEGPKRPGQCTFCAVFVLSAGPDGVLQTPFDQPLVNANIMGDDIAVRVQ